MECCWCFGLLILAVAVKVQRLTSVFRPTTGTPFLDNESLWRCVAAVSFPFLLMKRNGLVEPDDARFPSLTAETDCLSDRRKIEMAND